MSSVNIKLIGDFIEIGLAEFDVMGEDGVNHGLLNFIKNHKKNNGKFPGDNFLGVKNNDAAKVALEYGADSFSINCDSDEIKKEFNFWDDYFSGKYLLTKGSGFGSLQFSNIDFELPFLNSKYLTKRQFQKNIKLKIDEFCGEEIITGIYYKQKEYEDRNIEESIENIYVEIFQFMSFQFDPPNNITSFSERNILSAIKDINQ